MRENSRITLSVRRTMRSLCITGALFLALACTTGCGGADGKAMPLTDEKMREFDALQGPSAPIVAVHGDYQGPDDAQLKAAYESLVAKPLEQMGYTYDATVRAALEAEKDNPNFLDPIHLPQPLWWYFVRQPIAERERLLRWGAISQGTYDLLEAAGTKGR